MRSIGIQVSPSSTLKTTTPNIPSQDDSTKCPVLILIAEQELLMEL
jgi:hypothetical protein